MRLIQLRAVDGPTIDVNPERINYMRGIFGRGTLIYFCGKEVEVVEQIHEIEHMIKLLHDGGGRLSGLTAACYCEECRYYRETLLFSIGDETHEIHDICAYVTFDGRKVEKDHFCSYATRKQEVKK